MIDAFKLWARKHLFMTSLLAVIVFLAVFGLLVVFAPALLIGLIVGACVAALAAAVYTVLDVETSLFQTKAEKAESEALQARLLFSIDLAQALTQESINRNRISGYTPRAPEEIELEVRSEHNYWGER